MIYEEIIKALECCADGGNRCDECPYGIGDCLDDDDKSILLEDALKLIKRQKAEIERLQKAIKVQDIMIEQQDYNIKSKSEVLKEFAERLKCNASILCDKVTGLPCSYTISSYNFDRLVKEMVGEPSKVEHDSLCETETYKGVRGE